MSSQDRAVTVVLQVNLASELRSNMLTPQAPERLLGMASPPHLRSPEGELGAWFTEPPGVVLQFLRPTLGTESMARWIVGPALSEVFRRYPEERGLFFVFDLSLMTGREVAARSILIQSAPKMRHRFCCSVLILPASSSAPFVRTVHAGAALLRTLGVHIDIDASLSVTLRRLGLTAAGR